MTRSIHGPVRRDVCDKWHVSGGVWVKNRRRIFKWNLSLLLAATQHNYFDLCRSIKYLFECAWKMDYLVACYDKYHNTNIFGPLYISCITCGEQLWYIWTSPLMPMQSQLSQLSFEDNSSFFIPGMWNLVLQVLPIVASCFVFFLSLVSGTGHCGMYVCVEEKRRWTIACYEIYM